MRQLFMNSLLALAAGLSISGAAHAAPIVGAGSLPGGNPIYLPAVNITGAGPITIGGLTWSSNVPTSLFGWTGGYTFGNGSFAAGQAPAILLNAGANGSGYATMTLRFPALTAGFLGEFYWRDGTSGANSVNIAVYNRDGALLEYRPFNNNGNGGIAPGYYGFSRPTADIAYVNISNGFIGARNLSWVGPAINAPSIGGAVPEPATWAIMIGGLGLAGASLRARSRRMRLA